MARKLGWKAGPGAGFTTPATTLAHTVSEEKTNPSDVKFQTIVLLTTYIVTDLS